MRNFVPVVGIAISARWNYVATRRLAGTVRRYVRDRRALRDAMTHLQIHAIAEPEFVAEGAWLLSTVDGVAPGEDRDGGRPRARRAAGRGAASASTATARSATTRTA